MDLHLTTLLSYKNHKVEINRRRPTTIIGERINPAGRKKVREALIAGNLDSIRQDAIEQVKAGAAILDINAEVPGLDEPELLEKVARTVMEVVDVPLCIDTTNPAALARVLEIYPGKALVNSVNGEERSLREVLPIVRDHQAAVIGVCMDDGGIPPTAEKRLEVAARIIERAGRHGISTADIIIDPLAQSLGAESNAGYVALHTIELVVDEFGVNISMGASNISAGLPDRKYINAAFLAMAIHAGLSCPITSPLVTEVMAAIQAADLLMGRDENTSRWIEASQKRQAGAKTGV